MKDIVSPAGAVSITDADKGASDDVDGHTKVGGILVHRPDGDRLFVATTSTGEPIAVRLFGQHSIRMVDALSLDFSDEDMFRFDTDDARLRA